MSKYRLLREQCEQMPDEELKEIVRQELLERDHSTLVDAVLVLMDREQLIEWALPRLCREIRKHVGKLKVEAAQKIFPDAHFNDDGLMSISLVECAAVSRKAFSDLGVLLTCEGIEGDHLLMSVHAPMEIKDETK